VTEPGEGEFTYAGGTVVDLVAAPDEGYWFVNWTGDVDTIADVYAATTTITMRDDYAISANFAETQAQCDLTISSTAGGSVTEPGEGTFAYDGGTTVELVAQPDEGYRFVNWTGDVYTVDDVSAAATTTTMYGDFSIRANFAETGGPWPMFGQNPQRRSPYSGPEVPYQKWSFTTEGMVFSSPAIGADGIIYVGSDDHKLYAINPDGSQKWSFTTGDDVGSSPAIGADGTIYVGSHDSNLYAINPDGSQKWRFTTGGDVESSPAIGAGGTIYVGSHDHRLYAINPDGSQKWRFTTGGDVESSPAIGADGTIYVGSMDNKLYAINPDGSQKWSFTTGGLISSSPAIGAGGTIYVGSHDHRLYAINPDGSQKWSFTTGGLCLAPHPPSGLTAPSMSGLMISNLYAINPDGSQKWSFTTGSYVYSSPAIGAGGTIYVGSMDNKLYAVNPDGSQKWSFTTGGDVESSPAIGAGGTIYVGSWDYRLYAITEAPDYTLAISSTDGGSVTEPGEGEFTYAGGTVVDLVAAPDEGYWFVNWTGDVDTIADVYAATTTITMRDDYAITANFAEIQEQCDLTISSTAGGSVTEPGEGTFTYDGGTTVELVAQPDEGYRFVNWTGDVYTVDDVYAAATTTTMYGDFSITANFAETGGPWPMFGQNPQRTGRSPYSGPEVPTLKWSFTTGHWVQSSPAIGADGTIYVGSDDHNLYAINPDGSQKWSFATGGWVDSSPAIGADGTIYVGSDDNLYAINPDGSQKWSFTTGGWVSSSPAIGADGTIYVGSHDHNLYAINPDGSQKWRFTTGGDVDSSPAIGGDGTIYVGSIDNKLYAINPDGSQKWSFTTGDYVYSSPAIGAGGTIYVGSYDYNLYAINPDGSQKWSFTTGGGIGSSPAIGADGTIYVGSGDDKLYAINPDGSQKWSFTTGRSVFSSPAIGADGTIYVGSGYMDRKLYAINPDGSQKWSFTTRGHVDSSPAIGADGTIYVGSWDYRLYAITEAPDYTLAISSTDGGSVTEPGEGEFTYASGTVVDLVAAPDEGYWFVNWTGDVDTIADVYAATTTITMQDNYSITANFEEKPSGGMCFIATAAYGTPMAEETEILREFRDRYLLTNRLGQALTGLYYRISPPIAGLITEHPGLKPIVRVGLLPAVAISAVAVNTTPTEKVAIVVLLLISMALAIWATKRRNRGPQYT
jgi:large repetitive protein